MKVYHGDDEIVGCIGKKVYPSYWAALRAAKSLSKYRDSAKPNVYRCSRCHFWHVGNTMGKLRENRKSRHNIKGKGFGYNGRI